ncbi:pyruvate dehydrogenase E2 component (dihydrolipoamide acetyltransferase) [Peteryoungia aggregata LMG 23059]|uniref:Pyruvate dehydrogenase E2 component (Dihydrolipoamide acetyltransferase) n=1 Tax=Peteryoungia aggregata LMG 23059 TaxID=1368425 RepID=A0ABU0GF22_9HYPH|nr:alpha/beta fold hydrolase [Peteryoungia aggregata]MDQ0423220.1 pyruvate dehydrogenase E2 component (dihydrolipoamide acetyltransferase) [Peteryoungia aggregata LMG 23059]
MALFAEVRHPSSAKAPLVLLHGFGGIGAVREPVLRRLDPDLPLVVYDLPGHGRSLDADGVGHGGVMARAILADLDRREISSFHLCGHSMGGAIASLIALKAVDHVRSLTLLAPGGFGPEINHEVLRRYGSAVETGELALGLAAMSAPGSIVDAAVLERLADARRLPGATVRLMEILNSFLVETNGRIGQGRLPLSSFEGFGVETRLLWGAEDPILPVTQASSIWKAAEVTLIEGVGHMLIDEAPEAVASAMAAAVEAG